MDLLSLDTTLPIDSLLPHHLSQDSTVQWALMSLGKLYHPCSLSFDFDMILLPSSGVPTIVRFWQCWHSFDWIMFWCRTLGFDQIAGRWGLIKLQQSLQRLHLTLKGIHFGTSLAKPNLTPRDSWSIQDIIYSKDIPFRYLNIQNQTWRVKE